MESGTMVVTNQSPIHRMRVVAGGRLAAARQPRLAAAWKRREFVFQPFSNPNQLIIIMAQNQPNQNPSRDNRSNSSNQIPSRSGSQSGTKDTSRSGSQSGSQSSSQSGRQGSQQSNPNRGSQSNPSQTNKTSQGSSMNE
ncbi:MAG: hypothetical protein Q8921_09470 [Bacteroidota bacterium]|nr:hypothetical protein [Bacteroidota bacterium]